MNGTQGFQGCPGQRGVKVKKRNIFNVCNVTLIIYGLTVFLLLLRVVVGIQEKR